jgi:predicted acyl esterase
MRFAAKCASAVLPFVALCSGFFSSPALGQDNAPELKKILERFPDGTTHRSEMIPMRDGVKLATEIFIPPGGKPLPAVLVRTPYGRFDGGPFGGFMNGVQEAGKWKYVQDVAFVGVTQDLRGRYGSEGAATLPRESFANEVADSADTLDWIAGSPGPTAR